MSANGSSVAGTPVIVWLPAWSAGPSAWERMLPLVAPICRHRVVDLSSCSTASELVDESERALLAAVASAPARQVVLIGWSMGAGIATELVRRHPQQVSALGLIGAMTEAWPTVVLRTMKMRLGQDSEALLNDFDERAFSRAEQRAGELASWQQIVRRTTPEVAALSAGLDVLEQCPPQLDVVPVDLPARVLHGSKDGICPVPDVARLPSHWSLAVWTGGHMLPWTHAHDVASWVDDLVASTSEGEVR